MLTRALAAPADRAEEIASRVITTHDETFAIDDDYRAIPCHRNVGDFAEHELRLTVSNADAQLFAKCRNAGMDGRTDISNEGVRALRERTFDETDTRKCDCDARPHEGTSAQGDDAISGQLDTRTR